MAFANFSVLALGSLLMLVPVLLHLLMKKRPRPQVFPAMRFLQQRQRVNQRQMNVRNWLLLLLRLLAIGLLALLFARPSVDSVSSGYWLRAGLVALLGGLAAAATALAFLRNSDRRVTGLLGAASAVLLAGGVLLAAQAMWRSDARGLGDAQAPVAAVLVFDTSPRMGLRHHNETRLAAGQTLARKLISQLPVDSEVAVVDAANTGGFLVDLTMASSMIDSLQVRESEHPLSELILRGWQQLTPRTDKRRELYVVTELSEHVWQASALQPLRRQLDENPEVSLFVLDVGVPDPTNVQLGRLQLSAESLPVGQPLRLTSEVHSLGYSGRVHVELQVEMPDASLPIVIDGQTKLPRRTNRDRVTLDMTPDSRQTVQFELTGLPLGLQHGLVRLTSADGLSMDDVRYFSCDVRPPRSVLLIQGKGATAEYVRSAISPSDAQQQGRSAFRCDVLAEAQFLSQPLARPLSEYAAVALLDPGLLTEQHWRRLADYARQGGGVGLFLGRNAMPAKQFSERASALLPGALRLQWKTAPGESLFLAPSDVSHPIFNTLRGRQSLIDWALSPIYTHWHFAQLNRNANTLLGYSNGEPAIIETSLGAGRVLTMTTPMSDRRKRSRPWNHFPTGDDQGLAFFVLSYGGIFPYLTDGPTSSVNLPVTAPIQLATDPDIPEENWQMFTPPGDWQNVRTQGGVLSLAGSEHVGTYRFKPVRLGASALGVSVNLPPESTQLARLPDGELDTMLGADNYIVARDADTLRRGIGRARVGRELFPFLMLVVVVVVAMEQLISNRFYGTVPPATTTARSTTRPAA